MAKGKEIRRQIGNVKSTQKITRAMEMEAASKMRKAQIQMERSLPYAKKIRQVIGHLMKSFPEYRHPFMEARPFKRVGYVVVSTDRGFCGGLNVNLFKQVLKHMQQWRDQSVEMEFCTFGRKSHAFFQRLRCKIVAHREAIGEVPQLKDLIGSIKVMLDSYKNGEIDALFVCHNEFVNTMKQTPDVDQVLPFPPLEQDIHTEMPWDYLYEPEAEDILDILLTRFIESQIYHAVVDNVACEQASRMVAMKSATDNAGNIIEELQLIYNKARQAAITTELTEIVAGADAVS